MDKAQNNDAMFKAIREAVEASVKEVGIEAVRQMSWFPSSRKKDTDHG